MAITIPAQSAGLSTPLVFQLPANKMYYLGTPESIQVEIEKFNKIAKIFWNRMVVKNSKMLKDVMSTFKTNILHPQVGNDHFLKQAVKISSENMDIFISGFRLTFDGLNQIVNVNWYCKVYGPVNSFWILKTLNTMSLFSSMITYGLEIDLGTVTVEYGTTYPNNKLSTLLSPISSATEKTLTFGLQPTPPNVTVNHFSVFNVNFKMKDSNINIV